jgi:hypothetical protein
MRNNMMFMSVAVVAACCSYKPVLAAADAGATSATASTAAAPATSQPAAKVAQKRALTPIAKRLVARIDLSSQTMNVAIDGQSQYSWKISSGAANGYQTPTGTYTPTHTTVLHRSRKYDNAPMPHAVFFRSGFAVHATGATWALGRPASHGCVRLSPGNAKTFYSLVNQYGKSATQIRIAGVTPVKTSLRAQPAGSSRRSRSFSEPGFSWTGYSIGSYAGSYGNHGRMTTTRRGNKIVHTWW